ncbi:MAG: UbiA family prenyltransferase [Byssovorax sp.]
MSPVAYLRLYRVKDWVHFLPLPFAGWIADPQHPGLGALAGGVLAWGLGLAYTSAINQAYDERVDRAWKAKNPVGGVFNRRQAIALSIPPAIASLVVLALLAPMGLWPGVALLVAATLYSAPPRLKRFPILGTLWNLLVGVPGFFFAGRPSVTELPLRPLVGLFSVLLLGSQLIHEAQDRDDDVEGEVRTIATEGGRKVALIAASALVLATPLLGFFLAEGVPRRAEITGACALFAAGWGALLWSRSRCDDSAELKRLRLGYRYSVLCLGALIFAAVRI